MSSAPGIWLALVFGAVAGAAGRQAGAADIGPVQVFLTAEEGRRRIFPGADVFQSDARAISASLQARLQRDVGSPFHADTLRVHLAYDEHRQLLGYTVVGEQIGKYRPITFIVGIDPEFKVRGVAVLVYRESRGGQVRRQRFLRQYRGKSTDDPIRLNRDIINITGATMSVRALNVGVRRILAVTEMLYGAPPPAGSDSQDHSAVIRGDR